MALIQWDPFAELNSLHNQVNSLFNDSFGSSRQLVKMGTATDVYSNKDGLTVEVHLPNFAEDEISVEQHQGELEIKAEHQEQEKSKDKKYIVRESATSYYRRFTLPKNANTDNISAKFENGILKVVVPYKELPKPKKIQISARSKTKSKK